MAINNQPTIKPRTVTGIFTQYIAKTLPLAFDESMSYYECLCALLEYLNETIVPDINNTNEGLEELQNLYLELQSYVNTYFDNLDVQAEINNKLDKMAQNGTLTELIKDYVDPIYGTFEQTINSQVNEINNKVNSLTSGSPAGVYSTVSDLTTADPDHTKIYVVTATGNWYYYNTSTTSWTSGGTYQATKLDYGSVKPENTTFFDYDIDYTNLFNIDTISNGLIDRDGVLNPTQAGWQTSAYMPVEAGTTYYYSVNGTAGSIERVAFYDSTQTFVEILQNQATYTPNENGYIRLCKYATFNAKTQWQATAVSAFVPYHNVTVNGVVEEYYKNTYARINDNTGSLNAIDDYLTYVNTNATVQNGYYTGTTFYPNDGYRAISYSCNEYEKYRMSSYLLASTRHALVYFYDANDQSLGNTGIITENTATVDYEFITPKNCKRLIIDSSTRSTPSIKLEKLDLNIGTNSNLVNKKCIFIGDSIVAQTPTSWRTTFLSNTNAVEELCTAVAGARLTDYNDTVLNGTDFTGHGNTVCNQVQRIINNHALYDPDIIIIAAGTNDTNITATELDGSVTQFINENNEYININSIDRTRVDGAMRWQTEQLLTLYPNAVIFYATPIQAAQNVRASWWIIKMGAYMRKVCNYLALPIIDAGNNSTIYGRYETENVDGRYLVDGLHPNASGKVLLGNFYSKEVNNYFNK